MVIKTYQLFFYLFLLSQLSITLSWLMHLSSLSQRSHNCDSILDSVVRRCDNRMHFARQGSGSQGYFMRQATIEEVFSNFLLSILLYKLSMNWVVFLLRFSRSLQHRLMCLTNPPDMRALIIFLKHHYFLDPRGKNRIWHTLANLWCKVAYWPCLRLPSFLDQVEERSCMMRREHALLNLRVSS